MARTRFRGGPSRRHVMAPPDDRRPKNPGDAPRQPPEPPGGRWSLVTYPHVDPTVGEDATDGEEA